MKTGQVWHQRKPILDNVEFHNIDGLITMTNFSHIKTPPISSTWTSPFANTYYLYDSTRFWRVQVCHQRLISAPNACMRACLRAYTFALTAMFSQVRFLFPLSHSRACARVYYYRTYTHVRSLYTLTCTPSSFLFFLSLSTSRFQRVL